jgi:polar amino acid transport system substrate-binding protein
MSVLRCACLALLFASSGARAVSLRICVDIDPHPPMLTPDGGGVSGRLAQAAARAAGFTVEFHAAPVLRCRAELLDGKTHAFPMTPYIVGIDGVARYPERNGSPDRSRASGVVRQVVFRRAGSSVDFDGSRFLGLDKPVLVPTSRLRLLELVAATGAPIDANALSLQRNFDKLLAGRGDASAGFEGEGLVLLALPQYAGKIEMLPLPLGEEAYYLVVARSFYDAHRDQVEAMWNEIGRLKALPEFQLPLAVARPLLK